MLLSQHSFVVKPSISQKLCLNPWIQWGLYLFPLDMWLADCFHSSGGNQSVRDLYFGSAFSSHPWENAAFSKEVFAQISLGTGHECDFSRTPRLSLSLIYFLCLVSLCSCYQSVILLWLLDLVRGYSVKQHPGGTNSSTRIHKSIVSGWARSESAICLTSPPRENLGAMAYKELGDTVLH